MNISNRPFTNAQKDILRGKLEISPLGKFLQFVAGTLAGFGGGGIILFNLTYKMSHDVKLSMALGLTIGIGYIFLCWRATFPGQGTKRNARAQDLVDDKALVYSYKADDAIRVEELKDEGSHYFLHLTDGTVLFLSGNYLYEEEDENRFPCTYFEVIQAPHSKIVFDVVCKGKFLPPSKTLKPFRKKQLKKNEIPQNLEIVEIPWNQIETKYF